jgi:hypothetical protein
MTVLEVEKAQNLWMIPDFCTPMFFNETLKNNMQQNLHSFKNN